MPRRRKVDVPDGPLARMPDEILKQFVREGRSQPRSSTRSGGSRRRLSSARWAPSSPTISGSVDSVISQFLGRCGQPVGCTIVLHDRP